MDEDDPQTPTSEPFQPPPPSGKAYEQAIPEDHQDQIPEPETPPEHQKEGVRTRNRIMKRVMKRIMSNKTSSVKMKQLETCICYTRNKLISLA